MPDLLLDQNLRKGLLQLSMDLSDQQIMQLLKYVELLKSWNKSYNLTAITDPFKSISYHLLDSLSILPAVGQKQVLLDVGSGAGLPGLPLAIAMPQSEWTLLDSNGKKTRFVQQALASCQIKNVAVVKSRIEDYHVRPPWQMIVSRAFASLADFVESVSHLCDQQTVLLTMKTRLTASEKQELDSGSYQIDETELIVPGITEHRSQVLIHKKL